jgi:pimeloyl-ACP methyl ester carboxylesterase
MGVSLRRAVLLAAILLISGVLAAVLAAVLPGKAAPAVRDITAAPTEVAHTALGAVGYREVGSGPTLLMITGFSAGMDDWAPYFVDDLAKHFRVVVFDSAGIGQTAALPAPLSVPEMAAQTSALISTLGLGRCGVLGWSMGGLIAQSLAVTHPHQVRRLVLAATQAGTGNAAPVPAAALAALNSGNPAAVLSVLFPADQNAATQRYLTAILTYPDRYTSSPAVQAEQQTAIDQWFAGDDVSGRDVGEIRAPTLIADGTEDALDPMSNDRILAQLIHGARLSLHPGAGHGFLFQDSGTFVSELTSFLG